MQIIDATSLTSYLFGVDVHRDAAVFFAELANDVVSDVAGDMGAVPARVRAITLEVAARGLRNAPGYSSVTTTFDDTTKTWRREPSSSQGVVLTDTEIDELLAIKNGAPVQHSAGSFSMVAPR